jgi:hypothetical protein
MISKSGARTALVVALLGAAFAAAPASAAAADCPGLASPYSDAVLETTGLRSYHRLAEASGSAACDSAGGNAGTYAGSYALGTPGAIAGGDRAVSLSGTGGHVRVPSSTALNPTGPLTLEAWVRPSSAEPSQTVIRKDGQYLLRLSGGRAIFRLWSSWSSTVEVASAAVVEASAWQHLVAVYDGAAMRIYRNGEQVASRSRSGAVAAGGSSLHLGASSGSYDYLGGGLDDVALYGVALSPAAVARHYELAQPASEPPPSEPPPSEPPPSEPPPSYPSPPAGASWTCGFGGFVAGSWPGACWRPYADSSPFNRRLPASPKLAQNSAGMAQRILGFGAIGHLVAGEAGTPSDWAHPTYYPDGDDPYFTLHCVNSWGTCAVEGHRIRIPDAARAAAGGDAHLTVVDQASGWEYDLWDVRSKPAGGGRLDFGWGGRTRIDGDGRGSDATAARFGNLAGIIRAQELQAGVIPHALFAVVKCGASSPRYVYPAMKNGTVCADTTNAPPMGSHLWLAMSHEQIEALAVPRWKKTVLHAMADYGMFMGDTGGSSWGVQAESGQTYTSFGREDPLVTFAKANGWEPYYGRYVGRLRDGVDWARYLRVLDPCVSQGTC